MAAICVDLWTRLTLPFLPSGPAGGRPCFGGNALFDRPHWRELLLFHEYFDPETGRGVGASHQTGWTALVLLALNRVGRARAP